MFWIAFWSAFWLALLVGILVGVLVGVLVGLICGIVVCLMAGKLAGCLYLLVGTLGTGFGVIHHSCITHTGDGFCHFGFENRPTIDEGMGFQSWVALGCTLSLSATLDQNPLPVIKPAISMQSTDNVGPHHAQEMDFATSDLKIGQ